MLVRSLTFYLLILIMLTSILNSCSRDQIWLAKFNYQDKEYSVRIMDVREDLLVFARRHPQIATDIKWHKNYLFSKYLSQEVAVLEELDRGLMNNPDFETAYEELSKQGILHETIIKQIALEQFRKEFRKKFADHILPAITEEVLKAYYEENKDAAVEERDGRMIPLTFPQLRDEIYDVVCEEYWSDFVKTLHEEMKNKYNVVYNEGGIRILMDMELNYIDKFTRVLGPNMALNKTATASSILGSGYEAGLAFDGKEETEWSPAANNNKHWLAVDLGEKIPIGRVVVEWGENYPQDFIVQISPDGYQWMDAYSVNEATGGVNSVNEVLLENINERYVRIFIAGNVTFSLKEFEVYN